MMANVATNFALDRGALFGGRGLQAHADVPLARATLEQVLESTGDGYIRRKAAQSILGDYSRRPHDPHPGEIARGRRDFARFLDDMVQTNCR